MQFKLGELFCGAGGLGYAATTAKIINHDNEEISIKHAWATDYNNDACCTYANNIVNTCYSSDIIYSDLNKTVICKDVRLLDFNNLSEIDALAFWFP